MNKPDDNSPTVTEVDTGGIAPAREVLSHRCPNCEYFGPLVPLAEIEHLAERIDPGEIVPEGECHECGALVPPPTEERMIEEDRPTLAELLADSPETTDLWYCWKCGEREHFVGHDGAGFLKQSVTVQVSEGAPDLDYGACHDVEIGQYDEIMCGNCGEQVWEDPRPPVPSTAAATIRRMIEEFDKSCGAIEYTDTDTVWTMFHDIYRLMGGNTDKLND